MIQQLKYYKNNQGTKNIYMLNHIKQIYEVVINNNKRLEIQIEINKKF